MEPEPFVGSPDRDIVPKEITTITNTKSVSFSPDRDIVPKRYYNNYNKY